MKYYGAMVWHQTAKQKKIKLRRVWIDVDSRKSTSTDRAEVEAAVAELELIHPMAVYQIIELDHDF